LSIDKALKEDATVFQYDEVYDEMEKKKEHTNVKKKDVKVCVIYNLLVFLKNVPINLIAFIF